MNKLTIIGNLADNPQTRVVNTANGTQNVCNFTVATNRFVRGQKRSTFFRVSCWGKQAENAMKYLLKGRKVAVTGPVEASAYIAQDNSARARLEVYADEIEYLSSTGNGTRQYDDPQTPPPSPNEFTEVDDDELPF